MAVRRITLSVPEAVARRIKKAARGKPVSAWVTGVIEEHLDDTELERQWGAFCRDVNPSAADARRASALHERLTKPGRRRGAAVVETI
jgi:hypothetical protein